MLEGSSFQSLKARKEKPLLLSNVKLKLKKEKEKERLSEEGTLAAKA